MAREAERDRRLLRAAQRGDRRARERLVASHLALVRSVAARYRSLGLPFDDLAQEGALGLLDAVDRFDARADADFERFARFRIRRAIQSALTDQSRLVRLPKHIVERRRALAHAAGGRPQSPAVLAATTGLSLRAVAEALAAEITPVSLEALGTSGTDLEAPDPERRASEHVAAERLEAALRGLPSRQRTIINRTFGLDAPPRPIAAVAAELGLSRERARTILQAALAKLRTTLEPTEG